MSHEPSPTECCNARTIRTHTGVTLSPAIQGTHVSMGTVKTDILQYITDVKFENSYVENVIKYLKGEICTIIQL
jgi:hypothetical protein